MALWLACTLASPVLAARLTVDAAGAGDFTDIQDAIDAALPGDYVLVSPGTYGPAALDGWVGPLLSTAGSEETTLVAAAAGDALAVVADDGATAIVAGFTLDAGGGYDGLDVSGAQVTAWDLAVHGARFGLRAAEGATLDVSSSLVTGATNCSLCSDDAALSATQVTLVDGQYHLLVNGSAVMAVSQSILYDGFGVSSCGGGTIGLSYGLVAEYTGSAISSCMSTDHLLLDFEPAFVDWSDDGDWTNDDFSLAEGAVAIDAGDPGCTEADGTTCDLGVSGGERENLEDADGDRMPDNWETSHGLDPDLPDSDDDSDGDGLDALGEWLFGTDPNDPDSDGDGAGDLLELQVSLDPLDVSDQAPTAVLVADATGGFVGAALGLDASGSTDPAGQSLDYAWTLTQQPTDSAMTGFGLRGATPSLTPDATGWWEVTVEVDDGLWAATASLSFYVHAGTTVQVPGDFATLGDAADVLLDGMTVALGIGVHAADVVLETDVWLQGAGVDATVLDGWLALDTGVRARLTDLTVAGASSSGGSLVPLSPQSWLDVRNVTLDQTGTFAWTLIADEATLTGWGLVVRSVNQGMEVRSSVVRLGHSELWSEQDPLASRDSTLALEGAILSAGDQSALSCYTQGPLVSLKHATILVDSDEYALGVRAERLVFEQSYVTSLEGRPIGTCVDVVDPAFGYLGGPGPGHASCGAAMPWVQDTESLDAEGRLSLDSTAKRAGDIRDATAERVRPDLGAYAGRLGLDEVLPMADPDGDADGDGIAASTEWALGTSDDAWDSDGDGVHDLTELLDGDDPADAADHHPSASVTHGRAEVGDDAELAVRWTTDPDGDPCLFSWADGSPDNPRTEPSSIGGSWALGWSLECGDGASSGDALLLITEELHVPGDAATLEEAVALAQDHHRIVLPAGTHTGGADLRGTWVELTGAGPNTVIEGDVWTGAGAVGGLTIDGSLYSVDADVTAVAVLDGEWIAHGGTHRAVRVDGDRVALHDVDARNLTIDGDAFARGGLAAAVISGELRADLDSAGFLFGGSAEGVTVTQLGTDAFVLVDDDPTVAILEPWPGSVLWDAGSQTLSDLDGSREDVGHTGGLHAWAVDSDGDGMNDAWEGLHGVTDPADDPDGDTVDNLGEWQQGTDPNDADTDDDGLDDFLDPDPRDAGEIPITARLHADVQNPALGETVNLTAIASSAAGGQELAWSWSLITPADATAALDIDGPEASFAPDVAGTWWVSVEVQAGAYTDTVTLQIHTYDEVLVPEDSVLQDFVNLVGSGTVLVLEKNNYKGSLVVDKDLTIRARDGVYDASIDGTQGSPTLRVTDGAHLTLESVTLWIEAGETGIEIWDGGRVTMQQIRMVGGDVSFRIYDGSLDGRSFFALGARAVLELVDGTFSVRNAVLGYPGSDARTAITVEQGSVRIESSILDWRPDGGSWRTPIACMTVPQSCDFEVSMFRTLTPGGEGVLPVTQYPLDVTYDEPRFLLGPREALEIDGYMGAADLRLDHDSPALDAGQDGDPDADGSQNDQGVFGGAWGNWIDVDNDRDGFSELEGDCDDTDPEILGDPRKECDGASGCSAAPGAPAAVWLAGLLGLSIRRRAR